MSRAERTETEPTVSPDEGVDGAIARRASVAIHHDPPAETVSGGVVAPEPITIIITWDVRPGREAAFEEWAHGITEAGRRHPGHLGSNWFRLGAGTRRYRTILKFRDPDAARGWLDSDERQGWLRRVEGLATRSEDRLTGMETWFTLSGYEAGVPPRWKMFVVICLSSYPVSLLINLLLVPRLDWVPLLLRSAIGTVFLVAALTWVVLPRMTRLFRRWLYPSDE